MKKHHLHIVSAKSWGSGESYVLNLARQAIEHGDDITIITDSRYPEIGRRFQAITLPIEMPFSFARLAPNVLRVREVVREKKVSTSSTIPGKLRFWQLWQVCLSNAVRKFQAQHHQSQEGSLSQLLDKASCSHCLRVGSREAISAWRGSKSIRAQAPHDSSGPNASLRLRKT